MERIVHAGASLVVALILSRTADGVHVKQTVGHYGKYYSVDKDGSRSTVDNSYYVYTPANHDPSLSSKLPIILEIHGGAFLGGSPQTSANSAIKTAVSHGIAYVSVGYRLIGTPYFYAEGREEELLHVDAHGHISLDMEGRLLKSYKARRGRQEMITKCQYDTAQMIEHLIKHADEYGVDVQRIALTGGSAGGGEIHYLTWVYHQWHVGRYTPVGMVYNMAQLDYPVENVMDHWAGLWGDDVGYNTKVSTILQQSDCNGILGNPCCAQTGMPSCGNSSDLCNMTYHNYAVQLCGERFADVTFSDIRKALVWPRDDPVVGVGMERLWYNSANMQLHRPQPFYLYVHNTLNGTSHMELVHSSMHARNYAKFAELAGVNYTVYYTDYNDMTTADKGQERFPVADSMSGNSLMLNYRSNHDWVHQVGAKKTVRGSEEEQLEYFCYVFGIDCTANAVAHVLV